MKSDIFSLEYGHYDGTVNIAEVIELTNNRLTSLLALHPHAQKGIMFDDLHADIPLVKFQQSITGLKTQPDSLYSESAFEPFMEEVLAPLKQKGFGLTEQDGRSYISKKDDVYKQETRFLLRYESKGQQKFSCPALVAASYLYRLGYIGQGINISPLSGEPPRVSSNGSIMTILPAKYLQVEANARVICELIAPAALERINYYFY